MTFFTSRTQFQGFINFAMPRRCTSLLYYHNILVFLSHYYNKLKGFVKKVRIWSQASGCEWEIWGRISAALDTAKRR